MKIKYTTILLALNFCLIPIIIILMFKNMATTDTLVRMGDGGFGKSIVLLELDAGMGFTELVNIVDDSDISIAIYNDVERDDYTVREIYFNNRYTVLPMKYGRFFERKDLDSDKPKAVIGKNLVSKTYTLSDGQRYIDFEKGTYQVIGVIGYDNDTIIDNYLYISIVNNESINSNLVTLDFLNTEKGYEISENYVTALQNNGYYADIISVNDEFGSTIMPKIISARFFVGLLVSSILTLILLSVHWLQSQVADICIMRLCGASKFNITFFIAIRFFLIFVLACFVGSCYFIFIDSSYSYYLWYGYCFLFLFIILFLKWSLLYIRNVHMEEIVK